MQTQFSTPDTCPFVWVDITNPTPEELDAVARQYGLYYTLIKDCLEPDHLPKFEAVDHINFLITRIHNPKKEREVDSIQDLSSKIAIFYSSEFLITVHRLPQPMLEEVRSRYVDKGHCPSTTDLAIRIVHWVLHSYQEPGLALLSQLDRHESVVFLKTKVPNAILQKLYFIKRKAASAKRIVMLSNDILASLRRIEGDSPLLQDTQDLQLKVVTLYDQLEESVTGLLNIYLSLSAQRTNEVMRVLTIFSAFFLPLTFIAGIYGMNFDWMPELKWSAGYPIVLGIMLAVAAGIFVWFRRKGWL